MDVAAEASETSRTQMIIPKVYPKVVRKRLRHSSIAITMDIYGHLMPNTQGEPPQRLTSLCAPP